MPHSHLMLKYKGGQELQTQFELTDNNRILNSEQNLGEHMGK